MPNPLWVDARDYLTNKGTPLTTGSLNSAMAYLGQNPSIRPSYAKASPDAATSIGAGLGMPTDDLATPITDASYQTTAEYIPGAVGGGPGPRGSVSSYSPPAPVAPKPTSYSPPQAQAQAQPRTQGAPTRTEKVASTRSQPKKLPVNNRAETARGRSDPITTPVSTGSEPNIHATPANVALPPNVNPAIPDVSNGAYAPGGLEDAGLGTVAGIGGGLGAALLAMLLSRGRARPAPMYRPGDIVGPSLPAVVTPPRMPPTIEGSLPTPYTGGGPPAPAMAGAPTPPTQPLIGGAGAVPPSAAPSPAALESMIGELADVTPQAPPRAPARKPTPTKATVKPGKSRPTARKAAS